MDNSTQNHVTGFCLSLVAAMLWGFLPVAIKELLESMDATTIIWYRFLIAGLVLLCWLVYKKKLPALMQVTSRTRWFFIIAAMCLCSNYFLFSYSLNFVNGETSEAVIQLTTLFLILGGVVVYKESFVGIQKFGTVLIVIGLLLFFNDRLAELASFDNEETIGVGIVIIAAITWTAYALLQKELLSSFSSVQILFLIYVFSVLVLLPFITPGSLLQLTQLQFWLLVFCCINTLIAYGCFAEAMNLWDASKVSATLALAPLFTISSLKLVVFFNPDYEFSDRLGFLAICGALLLVIGSVLTALMPALRQRRLDAAAKITASAE